MRWRCSFGRMSPTVCVAALVWPLAWQSKQATPWSARRLRRSSVALNCCCGNGVTSSRSPSSCLGFRMSLNSSLKLASVTSCPLRDVAQVRPRRQEDRRGELRQQVLRQVEVEIEAGQVAVGLLLGLVDQGLREDHAARLVVRDAAAEESRPARASWLLISSGVSGGELLPGHARGQLHAHAVLHRLAARHRHARGRPVGEVVARRRAGPAGAWRTSASRLAGA